MEVSLTWLCLLSSFYHFIILVRFFFFQLFIVLNNVCKTENYPATVRWPQECTESAWSLFLWSLTDAGLAVRVQRVLLVAAAHWPRVCVVTCVLAAAISIVARYCRQARTQTHTHAGTCTHIQRSTYIGMEVTGNCKNVIPFNCISWEGGERERRTLRKARVNCEKK